MLVLQLLGLWEKAGVAREPRRHKFLVARTAVNRLNLYFISRVEHLLCRRCLLCQSGRIVGDGDEMY